MVRCILLIGYVRGVYLKLKTAEILFVLFYYLPILALHIEHLYKIRQRYLFGQVLASFIELVGYAYWLSTRHVYSVVFSKQYGHGSFIPFRNSNAFRLTEIAYLLINPCIGLFNRGIDKTACCQFIAVRNRLYKP